MDKKPSVLERIPTTKAVDETQRALRRHRMSTFIEEGQKNIARAKAIAMIKAPLPTPTPEPFSYQPSIERSVSSKLKHFQVEEVVRCRQKGSRSRPFCNYQKHQRIEKREKAKGRMPHPYYTMWEKNLAEFNQSRKKWIGGDFIVTDHKAALIRRERAEASSYAGLILGKYENPRYRPRQEDKQRFLDPAGWR